MASVGDIPRAEQRLHEVSARRLKSREQVRGSRFLRVQAVYNLLAELLGKSKKEQDAILVEEAMHGWGSLNGMKQDLRWARKINPRDLLDAFPSETDGESTEDVPLPAWVMRLTHEHFREVGKAKYPDGSPLTSKERVDWLVKAHIGQWYVRTLKDELVKAKLRPEPKENAIQTTADLLEAMGLAVRGNGAEILLEGFKGRGTYKVLPTLKKLQELYEREFPSATFTIGSDEKEEG